MDKDKLLEMHLPSCRSCSTKTESRSFSNGAVILEQSERSVCMRHFKTSSRVRSIHLRLMVEDIDAYITEYEIYS